MDLKPIIEEHVLPAVEIALEAYINKKSDGAVELLVAKLIEICPVDVVDMYIKAQEPALKKMLKEYFLAQAEKISDKV